MRLLESLSANGAGKELGAYASLLHADERTIRRDVDFLQDLLSGFRGIELRRGRIYSAREGFASGYFSEHVGREREAKESIARRIVDGLADNLALVITAGSTTFDVAREMRHRSVMGQGPRGLIALTNSLPALMELIAGGISTGVVGEVFSPDDCAFQTHDLRTA